PDGPDSHLGGADRQRRVADGLPDQARDLGLELAAIDERVHRAEAVGPFGRHAVARKEQLPRSALAKDADEPLDATAIVTEPELRGGDCEESAGCRDPKVAARREGGAGPGTRPGNDRHGRHADGLDAPA